MRRGVVRMPDSKARRKKKKAASVPGPASIRLFPLSLFLSPSSVVPRVLVLRTMGAPRQCTVQTASISSVVLPGNVSFSPQLSKGRRVNQKNGTCTLYSPVPWVPGTANGVVSPLASRFQWLSGVRGTPRRVQATAQRLQLACPPRYLPYPST